MLRFGEITRVIQKPGIYFKIPTSFVDTVQIIEDRLLSFDLEDIRVQVRDGRRYIVDAFVAFKITDPRKFRENVSGSLDIARENMRTRLDAALRRVYGQRSFEAALSEQRGEMMLDVRDQLRPLTAEVGIEIVDVRIKRTDLLPEVSQQTFERMKAERLAEAAQLARPRHRACRPHPRGSRSRGGGDGRRGASARRRSCAARAKRSGAASSPTPTSAIRRFFEFYRSMRAYEHGAAGDQHHARPVARFGVLPLLQECLRRSPAGRRCRGASAPRCRGAAGAAPAPPAPTGRRRRRQRRPPAPDAGGADAGSRSRRAAPAAPAPAQ